MIVEERTYIKSYDTYIMSYTETLTKVLQTIVIFVEMCSCMLFWNFLQFMMIKYIYQCFIYRLSTTITNHRISKCGQQVFKGTYRQRYVALVFDIVCLLHHQFHAKQSQEFKLSLGHNFLVFIRTYLVSIPQNRLTKDLFTETILRILLLLYTIISFFICRH